MLVILWNSWEDSAWRLFIEESPINEKSPISEHINEHKSRA